MLITQLTYLMCSMSAHNCLQFGVAGFVVLYSLGSCSSVVLYRSISSFAQCVLCTAVKIQSRFCSFLQCEYKMFSFDYCHMYIMLYYTYIKWICMLAKNILYAYNGLMENSLIKSLGNTIHCNHLYQCTSQLHSMVMM